MTELERLEAEVNLTEKRLQVERMAYLTAKMRLKEAKIAAGVIKPDEAVMKFIDEVRERVDMFKSKIVREVLSCLCGALSGSNTSALMDLDDKYHKFEQNK